MDTDDLTDADMEDIEELDADADDLEESDLEESDIEQLGIEDGTFDRDNNMSYMGSYGSSVDYENLTDEQKEAYEDGYMTGAEDYDLTTDDEDEDYL